MILIGKDQELKAIDRQTPAFLLDQKAINKSQTKKNFKMVVKCNREVESEIEILKTQGDEFYKSNDFQTASDRYQTILKKVEELKSQDNFNRESDKIVFRKSKIKIGNFEVQESSVCIIILNLTIYDGLRFKEINK